MMSHEINAEYNRTISLTVDKQVWEELYLNRDERSGNEMCVNWCWCVDSRVMTFPVNFAVSFTPLDLNTGYSGRIGLRARVTVIKSLLWLANFFVNIPFQWPLSEDRNITQFTHRHFNNNTMWKFPTVAVIKDNFTLQLSSQSVLSASLVSNTKTTRIKENDWNRN